MLEIELINGLKRFFLPDFKISYFYLPDLKINEVNHIAVKSVNYLINIKHYPHVKKNITVNNCFIFTTLM